MSGYPLQAVLDLRRREADAAALTVAAATRQLQEATAEEARKTDAVTGARARWQAASLRGAAAGARDAVATDVGLKPTAPAAAWPPPPNEADATDVRRPPVRRGADELAQARFVARLRAEWESATAALASFRSQVLSAALRRETAAREQYLTARRAHEIFVKHAARYGEELRRRGDRLADENLEEATRTAIQPAGRPAP